MAKASKGPSEIQKRKLLDLIAIDTVWWDIEDIIAARTELTERFVLADIFMVGLKSMKAAAPPCTEHSPARSR